VLGFITPKLMKMAMAVMIMIMIIIINDVCKNTNWARIKCAKSTVNHSQSVK